ncbi:RusA family crossover junction endodeoxyribonuclease [Mediterraneibacter massiliensis]|uniref:RusA family crossover junction endodeoxyribonuclease n=1 Tax=Mediterraneibacter massiliensis TaxID=1720300 RepID=UPI00073E37C2|nr:RusA family crossover junction endodeoxyribonuclease [Mediterraneibacter massiliensis]
MQAVSFQVPGKPQGKARARTFYNGRLKRSMTITPENTVLYENLIKSMYMQAAGEIKFEKGTPVTLRIVARFSPPASVSKKMKQRMLEGELLPLKKPDIDNIIKVVADSLNGIAYYDDTQVVLTAAKKAYSAVEGLDITVEEYTG